MIQKTDFSTGNNHTIRDSTSRTQSQLTKNVHIVYITREDLGNNLNRNWGTNENVDQQVWLVNGLMGFYFLSAKQCRKMSIASLYNVEFCKEKKKVFITSFGVRKGSVPS